MSRAIRRCVLLVAACSAACDWLADTPVSGAEPPSTARMVTVELLLVEGDANVVRGIETAEEPLKHLRALEEEEALASVTRLRLTTLEMQPASVQIGQRINVVTGRALTGRGGPLRETAISRGEITGTLLSLTSRVADDESIVLDLQFEQSQLAPSHERDRAAGEDPSAPPDIATINAKTAVRVPGGGTVVVGGGMTSSGKTSTRSLMLVTAKAGEPGPKTTRAADPAEQPEFKIYHLQHASATDLVDLLGVFFPTKSELTITADARTNSLLVRGKPEQLLAIEAIVMRLDAEKG